LLQRGKSSYKLTAAMFRVVLILCMIQMINSYNFLHNQKNFKPNNNMLNNNNIHELLHKNKYLLQPMEAVCNITFILCTIDITNTLYH